MRETKLYENIVAMYEKRLSELQAKLTQFDGDVDELRKSHPDSILLEWASDQKAGIQKQIEEYNVELARNRELIKGSVSGTARGIGPDIWPNKYSYITRIPELLRFYLSEVGGGPVKIDKLIHDVTKGGAKVYSRRPRKGEDRSEPRPLVRSDITKLFSDLRSGYEKQKTDS